MEAGAEIAADPPRVVALVEPTFVVSFPRSGSNFLQNVLRASSGRAARSIYDDPRDAPGAFSLKSHAPTRAYLRDEARRLLDLDPTRSRKLILVRDPRDVMISFFEYTQHKQATRIGQRHFVGSYDFFLAAPIDRHCRRRAETSALSVIDAYRKWLRDWAMTSPSNNELVVRYEALVSQPQATFAQLFAHLGLHCELASEVLGEVVSRYSDESRPRAREGSWRLVADRYRELLDGVEASLAEELEALGYPS